MKLKNKHTGQVGDFIMNKDHFECVDLDYVPEYKNLSELNEEWTDYEEPKGYWYINSLGDICWATYIDEEASVRKLIGNYFETEAEAEKAVEKLRAWKRLENKGFEFKGGDDACISYEIDWRKWGGDEADIDFELLFGGEE